MLFFLLLIPNSSFLTGKEGALALAQLRALRPSMQHIAGAKVPPNVRALRRAHPNLPLPLVQSSALIQWLRRQLPAANATALATLEWVAATLHQMELDCQDGLVRITLADPVRMLREARAQLSRLRVVCEAEEERLQMATLQRDQMLGSSAVRSLAYVYGFTVQEEDTAIEAVQQGRRKARPIDLGDRSVWQGHVDLCNPIKYRTTTLLGTGMRGYIDTADIAFHAEQMVKFQEELVRHERDNQRRVLNGQQPKKFKMKRMRADGNQPSLHAPEHLIVLPQSGDILFTETGNHRCVTTEHGRGMG